MNPAASIALISAVLCVSGCGTYYIGQAKHLPASETATVHNLSGVIEIGGKSVEDDRSFLSRMFAGSTAIVPAGPIIITEKRCISGSYVGGPVGVSCDAWGDPCILRFDLQPGGEYWIHGFWGQGSERLRLKGFLLADKPEHAFGVGSVLNHGFPNEEQARTQSLAYCLFTYTD